MRVPPSIPPRRVLAYARVSGEEQGRTGTSLEGQREAITAWCAERGYPAPALYVEVESASDTRIEKRTEQLRLQRDATAGDLVLVTKLDRWSRDVPHAVSTVRAMVKRGVGWLAIWMNLDASTREGDDRLTQEAVYAERERRAIYERTVLRKAELNAAGHYTKGNVPPGYERDRSSPRRPHPLRPSPLAPFVLDLFRRSDGGMSIEALRDHAHAHGHRWHKQTIGRMLRDRTYIGEVKVLLTGRWVSGRHEPIIPRDLFERVQIALDGRKKGGRRASEQARTSTWLLRGIARCARCGGHMGSAYGAKLSTNYYDCAGRARRGACDARRVRVDIVDPIVADLALARLQTIRHELAAAPSPVPNVQPAVPDLEERRRSLAARRSRVVDMIEHGTIPEEEGLRRLERISREEGRLEVEAGDAARLGQRAADPARRRALLADADRLARAWARMGRKEQREVLRRLAVRVEVERGLEPRVIWRGLEELLAEK